MCDARNAPSLTRVIVWIHQVGQVGGKYTLVTAPRQTKTSQTADRAKTITKRMPRITILLYLKSGKLLWPARQTTTTTTTALAASKIDTEWGMTN